MSDSMKGLYTAMVKARALRQHAEAGNQEIARTAGEWLDRNPSTRVDAGTLDAKDERRELNAAKNREMLRILRDGA